jgi:hypothetical protein
MNMTTIIKTLLAVNVLIMCTIIMMGCDVGVNPLIFDGSPLAASFVVNTPGTSYAGSNTLNMNDIVSDISKQIDSADVFNITLRVENSGTPDGTTISGIGYFNGTVLINLANIPLSTFATEKSIFDKTIPGFTVNPAGFLALRSMVQDVSLHPDSSHTATLSLNGYANQHPLQFTIHVKIYTQVYTKAK